MLLDYAAPLEIYIAAQQSLLPENRMRKNEKIKSNREEEKEEELYTWKMFIPMDALQYKHTFISFSSAPFFMR